MHSFPAGPRYWIETDNTGGPALPASAGWTATQTPQEAGGATLLPALPAGEYLPSDLW